jgi:hypothetical protein
MELDQKEVLAELLAYRWGERAPHIAFRLIQEMNYNSSKTKNEFEYWLVHAINGPRYYNYPCDTTYVKLLWLSYWIGGPFKYEVGSYNNYYQYLKPDDGENDSNTVIYDITDRKFYVKSLSSLPEFNDEFFNNEAE